MDQAPILSADKTKVTIGDQELNLEQSIDYKSATEYRTSIGKIKAFMHPGYKQGDTSTVWMRIVDMGQESVSEWISVRVWFEQFKRGMFRNTKKVKDDNKQPANPSNNPF